MENKDIQTYVQLYLNDVELNISVTDKLKLQEGNLKDFGYIQITDGGLDTKELFWDNLHFFKNCSKKVFKGECKKKLENLGYDWREKYKEIKTLIKRAQKLKILE